MRPSTRSTALSTSAEHEAHSIQARPRGSFVRLAGRLSTRPPRRLIPVAHEIEEAADQFEASFEKAFYALVGELVHVAINDLVDAIQAKLFHGPIFVKLWWFRFYIDPDSKVDALQDAAAHPPQGKHQIAQSSAQPDRRRRG